MSYITYSYLTEKMKKGKMRTSLNINQGKLGGGGGMVWYGIHSVVSLYFWCYELELQVNS